MRRLRATYCAAGIDDENIFHELCYETPPHPPCRAPSSTRGEARFCLIRKHEKYSGFN